MSRSLPGPLRRILAVRLDNIGDIVLLAPALAALKRSTGAELTLLCSPAGAQAVPLVPAVDRAIAARVSWQDVSGSLETDPGSDTELIRTLAEDGYDAAVIFTSFSQSSHPPAYACYLAGIPVRAAHSGSFAGAVLTHPVPPPPWEIHQADRNLHLLAELGITASARDEALSVPPEVHARVGRLLSDRGVRGTFALVAPGAGCDARRYPEASFARVVRLLAEDGLQAVVVGSARERELVERVACGGGASAVRLAGETGVPELAALVARASVVVANDSGALHLSDALRTPVVATFSGTDLVSQWAPRFAPAEVLRRDTDCTPCYRFVCPRRKECLAIPPEEVAAAAMRLARPTDANGVQPVALAMSATPEGRPR